MLRILITFASVATCIATLALVTVQRRELASMRARKQQLLTQTDTPESVSPIIANEPTTTISKPSPSIELLRLRGEVGQLERRKRALNNARAENETLRTQLATRGTNAPGAFVLPAGYIKKSEARFSGYGTPEDTIQSLLWAIQNQDATRVLQAFSPETAQHLETEIQRRGSPEEFFKDVKALPGMRIIEKETEPDGTAVLTVEMLPGDETHTERIRLKQFDSQWKLLSGF